MKIVIVLCMLSILGCSTIDVRDSDMEYRIENGLLRVYDPAQKSIPLTESIPSNTSLATENSTKTKEDVPKKNSIVKTSKKIQERLRKIHILTE